MLVINKLLQWQNCTYVLQFIECPRLIESITIMWLKTIFEFSIMRKVKKVSILHI